MKVLFIIFGIAIGAYLIEVLIDRLREKGIEKRLEPIIDECIEIQTIEESECIESTGGTFENWLISEIQSILKDAIIVQNCILNKKDKKGNDIYSQGKKVSKEINLIVLSKKGIFVLETKDWEKAFVSGAEDDKVWRVSFGKNKKIYQKFSLLKVVREDILTLKRYFHHNNFQPYVVFRNTTRICIPLKETNLVMCMQEFLLEMEYYSNQDDTLSQKEIMAIRDTLIEENKRARENAA